MSYGYPITSHVHTIVKTSYVDIEGIYIILYVLEFHEWDRGVHIIGIKYRVSVALVLVDYVDGVYLRVSECQTGWKRSSMVHIMQNHRTLVELLP